MRDPGPPVRLRSPHGSDPQLQDPLQPDRRTVYGTNTQDGHEIPVPPFQAPEQPGTARCTGSETSPGPGQTPGTAPLPHQAGQTAGKPGGRGRSGAKPQGGTLFTHRVGWAGGKARGAGGEAPAGGQGRSPRDGTLPTHRDRWASGKARGRRGRSPRRGPGAKPQGRDPPHPPRQMGRVGGAGAQPRKRGPGAAPRAPHSTLRAGGAPPAAPLTAPAPTASAHRGTRVPSVPPHRRPPPRPAG